jgi:hypothetical protein
LSPTFKRREDHLRLPSGAFISIDTVRRPACQRGVIRHRERPAHQRHEAAREALRPPKRQI